jgi:hypothetical protein
MCTIQRGWIILKKVNKIYPEIHNYENAVEGDQFFFSCGHMNDARQDCLMRIRIFFKKYITTLKNTKHHFKCTTLKQNRYSKIKNWMKIVF